MRRFTNRQRHAPITRCTDPLLVRDFVLLTVADGAAVVGAGTCLRGCDTEEEQLLFEDNPCILDFAA